MTVAAVAAAMTAVAAAAAMTTVAAVTTAAEVVAAKSTWRRAASGTALRARWRCTARVQRRGVNLERVAVH